MYYQLISYLSFLFALPITVAVSGITIGVSVGVSIVVVAIVIVLVSLLSVFVIIFRHKGMYRTINFGIM